MYSSSSTCFLLITFLTSSLILPATPNYDHEDNEQQKTFIVFVSKPDKPSVFVSHHQWYISTLASLPSSSPNDQQILYTYDHALHRFAARLTLPQAAHLRNAPGIVSVLPEQIHQLHTTRTPKFLGLVGKFGIWPSSNYGDGVIIGVLDTGIWPDRMSFGESVLPPVPKRWNGVCEIGPDFPKESCNRKIIGARSFSQGYKAFFVRSGMNESAAETMSPRDTDGHGTHCASTAAGSGASRASLGPYAAGIAYGMAPLARIAVYKVCWPRGCAGADILAAFENAITDGVDVVSMSLGGTALPYDQQPAMIGAFHAVQKGIVVSFSAGNRGPAPNTVGNVAPWVLTVGASTIDREFPANVILGDGTVLPGVSLFYGSSRLSESNILVYGGDCGSETCQEGKLDVKKVTGHIVVCQSTSGAPTATQSSAVKSAGGIGVIVAEPESGGEYLSALPHLIPGTRISYKSGRKIRDYIRRKNKAQKYSPVARIDFKGTSIGSSPSSPKIASFSSRGPNPLTEEILKPDIVAPGVNILAAWTGAASPTKLEVDPRRVNFNVLSGTSMACPHVSGIAALLKSAHPAWSPGAIKSAIMTTAYNLDNSWKNITRLADGRYATPFELGSGHVNPNKALDPGLVYDVASDNYADFLCSAGLSAKIISGIFTHTEVNCSGILTPGDLNYPSFSVIFRPGIRKVSYVRTVTNVGSSWNAVYTVKMNSPSSVKITVSPPRLVFSTEIRALSYTVSFSSSVDKMEATKTWDFGSIEWFDGVHVVRSPIAFTWDSSLISSV